MMEGFLTRGTYIDIDIHTDTLHIMEGFLTRGTNIDIGIHTDT